MQNFQFLNPLSDMSGTYVEVAHRFIPGRRGTFKVLWIQSEQQLYHKNSTCIRGISYVCQVDNCKVRAYLKEDKCYQKYGIKHFHAPQHVDHITNMAMRELKEAVRNDRMQPFRKIYNIIKKR